MPVKNCALCQLIGIKAVVDRFLSTRMIRCCRRLVVVALLAALCRKADAVSIAFLNTSGQAAIETLLDLAQMELSHDTSYEILDRQHIGTILAEQELALAMDNLGLSDRRHVGLLLRADLLLLFEPDKSAKAQTRVRICDVATGLVLSEQPLSILPDKLADDITRIRHALAAAREALAAPRIGVIAVPPFVCDDMEDHFIPFGRAYQGMVEAWVSEQPGLCLVSLEDARAFLREQEVSQDIRDLFRHPQPLIINGAYRHREVDQQRIAHLKLDFDDGHDLRNATTVECESSTLGTNLYAALTAQFASAGFLGVTSNAVDSFGEADYLWRRADEYIRLGQYPEALGLLETVLLLLPEDARCDFNGWHFTLHAAIDLTHIDCRALVYSRILDILPAFPYPEYKHLHPYYFEKWMYSDVSAAAGSAGYVWRSEKFPDLSNTNDVLEFMDASIDTHLRFYDWLMRQGASARGARGSFRHRLDGYIIAKINSRCYLAPNDKKKLDGYTRFFQSQSHDPNNYMASLGCLIDQKELGKELVWELCRVCAQAYPDKQDLFTTFGEVIRNSGYPHQWRAIDQIPQQALQAFECAVSNACPDALPAGRMQSGTTGNAALRFLAEARECQAQLLHPPTDASPQNLFDPETVARSVKQWEDRKEKARSLRVAIPYEPGANPQLQVVPESYGFHPRTERGAWTNYPPLELLEINLSWPLTPSSSPAVPTVWQATKMGFDLVLMNNGGVYAYSPQAGFSLVYQSPHGVRAIQDMAADGELIWIFVCPPDGSNQVFGLQLDGTCRHAISRTQGLPPATFLRAVPVQPGRLLCVGTHHGRTRRNWVLMLQAQTNQIKLDLLQISPRATAFTDAGQESPGILPLESTWFDLLYLLPTNQGHLALLCPRHGFPWLIDYQTGSLEKIDCKINTQLPVFEIQGRPYWLTRSNSLKWLDPATRQVQSLARRIHKRRESSNRDIEQWPSTHFPGVSQIGDYLAFGGVLLDPVLGRVWMLPLDCKPICPHWQSSFWGPLLLAGDGKTILEVQPVPGSLTQPPD